MRWLVWAILAAISACASVQGAPGQSSPAAPARLQSIAVRDAGLVATFYRPAGARRLPGIVVLGGSEGGIEGAEGLARPLAEHGYATLAVAFFAADSLPLHLQDVPLEYFDRAIAWMQSRPNVDPRRIGLIGGSKGAEAVLLIASRRYDLASVVAAAPSDVVWQGINREDRTPRSSWLLQNAPAAYVPFDRSQPFTTIHDLYERSRAQYGEEGEAVIAVEHIRAPLLLLAGDQDGLWNSAAMSRTMARRLETRHFAYPFRYVELRGAGHDVLGRPVTREQAAQLNEDGGTTEGNFEARRRAWPIILSWFDETLRP